MISGHNYPSDISREQYKLIRAHLENARKITKPRKVDLYDIFCAVLYVLKSGCQWRMFPPDFPKWNNVYAYLNYILSPFYQKDGLSKEASLGLISVADFGKTVSVS